MELVDWYIYNKPDKKMTRTIPMSNVIVMSQDMRLEITLGHEVTQLHEVILNQTLTPITYLASWKEGTIQITLPPDAKQFFVTEVEVTWS